MKILHILNTLFLAGILATLILIVLQLREPVRVRQPVAIQGYDPYGIKMIPGLGPVPVEITR